MKNIGQYLHSIAFWAVISAAFIGPGTVVTALTAGQKTGTELIWSLVFATFACIILQEAVARLSITTGKSLIEVIRLRYRQYPIVPIGAASIVLFGCIAYQAGNITGTAIPLLQLTGFNLSTLALLISLIAAFILYSGKITYISRILGVAVVLMGVGFIYLASEASNSVESGPNHVDLDGNLLLILALIGTTIVPYNLFLGSRVAREQVEIKIMRIGLSVSVVVGGFISIAILISGTMLPEGLDLTQFYTFYRQEEGTVAGLLFAIGLCGAGFTSSVTSPLAAAVTVQSTFPHKRSSFLATWIAVMIFGAVFASIGGSPTFIIIVAQAINGFFLPTIVWIIAMVINDTSIVKVKNGFWGNLLLVVVFFITSILGLINLAKATGKVFSFQIPNILLIGIVGFSVALAFILVKRIFRPR